ncbi:hypothetical protein BC826DRAFT_966260 [Russula brevipes]|nr:hypothetical protein BC826DRAFT_966260 [Russula brevipes]
MAQIGCSHGDTRRLMRRDDSISGPLIPSGVVPSSVKFFGPFSHQRSTLSQRSLSCAHVAWALSTYGYSMKNNRTRLEWANWEDNAQVRKGHLDNTTQKLSSNVERRAPSSGEDSARVWTRRQVAGRGIDSDPAVYCTFGLGPKKKALEGGHASGSTWPTTRYGALGGSAGTPSSHDGSGNETQKRTSIKEWSRSVVRSSRPLPYKCKITPRFPEVPSLLAEEVERLKA